MATNDKESVRARGEFARLSLDVDPDVLKHIVADGRLMELASSMAVEAAAQISAQLVDKVAGMAAGGGGGGVSASFVLEGGDFGTVPPRPKFGVGVVRFESLLQRAAVPAADVILTG